MNPSQIARIATLSVLCGIAPADAEEVDRSLSVGAYATWVFGPEHGLSWGLVASQLFLLRGHDTCPNFSSSSLGVGPVVRFGLRDLGHPRLVVAAMGGVDPLTENMIVEGFQAEAGVAIPLGAGTTGLHAALSASAPYSNLLVQTQPGMGEPLAAGLGVQVPGFLHRPEQCWYTGRPVRGADGRVVEGCTAPGAGALARAWADDARMEAASVSAFLALALELAALGAPEALIDEALDAADDEVLHASMAAAQHARVAGGPLRVDVPAPPARAVEDRERALCRLALESFVDGVVGEGSAADEAEATSVEDATLAAHFARVAADERRHAELGRRLVAWALQEGGEAVKGALRGALVLQLTVVDESQDVPGRLPLAARVALRGQRLERERGWLAAALG